MKYRRLYQRFGLIAKKIPMKKIVSRRTEITIETHQTIIWRTRVTRATDGESLRAPDELPEVQLYSEKLLPGLGIQPSAEGDAEVRDED